MASRRCSRLQPHVSPLPSYPLHTQLVKKAVDGIRRVGLVHEALHVLRRPELAPRVVEPGHNQRTEQGVVGGLHLVIAYAVEQYAIDELRSNQPELALA